MRRYIYTCILAVFTTTFAFFANADTEAVALLKKVDALYRSTSSVSTIKMHIVTPNWKRTLELQGWTIGMDDTFIRILSPKKDRGVATLKKGREMWNYFPKINKVIKVPPSMMMGSWMGSDFTNDDLVREVSLVKEYLVDMKTDATQYVLNLVPKKNTVTVWARIEIVITKDGLLPVEQRYFNEKGEKVRSMYFSNIREFSGKKIPATMSMVPHNKDNRKTIIEYIELEFDGKIDNSIFTLRNLHKRFQ